MQATAITPSESEAEIGQRLGIRTPIKWHVGDPFYILNNVPLVDLIVCLPPFGGSGRPHSSARDGLVVNDDFGNLLAARVCVEKLSDEGIGVFVLPASFVSSIKRDGLRASLQLLGLHLAAVIHIPSGFFKNTTIDSYISVLKRGHQTDLFVAELSQSPIHNNSVLNNFFAHRSGKHVETG